MATSELLDSYIDLPAMRKETDAFLAQLKELEKQYDVLKQARLGIGGAINVGTITQQVNTAAAAMNNFGTQVNSVNTAAQGLNQTATQTVNSTISQVKAVNQLSGAYEDLVKQSVANSLASKELLKERKELDASYKAGKISEDQYLKSLAGIKNEQLAISRSNQELNRALRNLGKDADSAEGSLDKLRAQLNIATQAFDRLSRAEKKAADGQDLKLKIQELNKAISEEEQATGRFQRNVGNYSSALSGVGNSIKSVIAQLAAAGVALVGLDSIGRFLSDSVDEFNQAEQAASRFKNILENVGRLDVLQRLTAEADKLSGELKQLDNDDITEVFQRLVVYGKLTENQIKQLTPVIIDFAAKQRISLEQASGVVTRALEGQGRSLKEYGINMKDAATPTEALALIMTELAPKVEGAAKAFGETTAGQIAITRQEINNLKEDIGGKLQPVLRNFYAFISEAISGVPKLFKAIDDDVQRSYDTISRFVRAGLGFGAQVRAQDAENATRQSIYDQNIKKEAILLSIRKEASNLADDASIKPLAEQQKILEGNIALENASRKNYLDLVASGKKFTEEGRKAGVELLRNKTITEALTRVMKQAADTSVIGGGDPNDRFTKAPKGPKAKAADDFTSELLANAEKERKANEDVNKLIIADDAAARERILSNEKNSLDDRLEALDQYLKDKEALITIDSKVEVDNINAKLDRITAIENKPDSKRTSAERKLLLEKEALLAQRVLSEARAQSLETALVRDGNNKRFDIIKSELDEETRLRLSNYKDSKDIDEAKYNDQLIALNNEFSAKRAAVANGSDKAKAKVEEEFAYQRLKIQEDYQLAALAKDIEFTEKEIKSAKLNGEETKDAEKKLSAARLQYSDLLVKRLEENEEKIAKTRKEKIDDLVNTLGKIEEIYGQITSVVSNAVNASATTKKNEIQEQIDLLEKRNQVEIEGINNSALSEEQKAAKISVLNARAQAQKAQYELKQKQIDQRKAEVDKQIAIGQIIIQTALSVAKVAAFPPLAILAAALGAAQLAIAIATPIPKYKHGKGRFDDYEGPAIWGDGGKSEMRITKEGKLELSPDRPTVTFVKKTDMIHPDAKEFVKGFAGAASKKLYINSPAASVDNKQLEDIKKKLNSLISVIENKPVAKITNTYRGVETSFENAQRQWQWINRNMQS